MTVGTTRSLRLRFGVKPPEHYQVESERFQEVNKVYTAMVERIAEVEDMRRSSRLDDSLQRRMRMLAQAEGVYGPWLPTKAQRAPRQRIMYDDPSWLRRHNILELLYQIQFGIFDPENLDREPWNELIAARGMLRLLTQFPRGHDLLCSLYHPEEAHTAPKVADCQTFLDANPLQLHDERPRVVEKWLAALFAQVPGAQRAIYRILAAYRQAVQEQWDQTRYRPADAGHLVGDEHLGTIDGRMVTWDELMRVLGLPETPTGAEPGQPDANLQQAALLVAAGTHPRDAAKQCGVSINRLYARLKELNITPPRKKTGPKSAVVKEAQESEE
jgi:hypothetical protein